ncbi:MAG: hypothetical protein K2L37_01935, partial [Lactobacillus sp.]|nr:hypothetical protein [Lactobacillus sp.]
SAYTLKATVTPADADDKTVDWSVTFSNSASAWANGKTVTDYVTITPTTDGALTATAECKAAFGEQIIITVTARANKEAKATCTVDYQRKLEYTNFKAVALDSNTSTLTLTHSNNSTVTWNWLTTLDPYKWDRYSNEYEDSLSSVYTIDDTVTSHSIEVRASAALQAALDKVTITVTNSSSDRAMYKKSYTFSGTSYDANKKFLRLSQFSLMGSREYSRDGIFYAWVDSYDDDGSEIDTYSARYYTAMKGALTSCSVDFEMTVKTTLASGATYSKTYNVNVADSSLRILVNGISMDKTGLVY